MLALGAAASRAWPRLLRPGDAVVFAAVHVLTGLTLVAVVDVHGMAFYFAWGLIGLALVTEAAPRSSTGAAPAAARGAEARMSDTSKDQRQVDPRKRGEAAWRAHRDAIASRNERASQRARARRRQEYERLLAGQRAAELRERAELAKRAH